MYYYSTIAAWENADLCDCPDYMEEVYGKKRKDRSYDNTDESNTHEDY